MRLSVGLYPSVPAPELAALGRRCEDLRYDGVWIPDSPLLWREAYTVLGAIGGSTRRVTLGTAVTNPITRRLTVTAGALVTLAELTGGRAVLGISTGDSALHSEGVRPARVDELRSAVRSLRPLLAGSASGGDGASAARIAYADGAPAIPIYIAATGPRMLALAGELADGVILMNGVAPDRIAAAMEMVRGSAEAAGRDPDAVQVVVWTACVAADAEQAAVDAVKYNVARAVLRAMPGEADDLVTETATRLRARYDYAEHGRPDAGFARLVPDELVPRFALAGTPERIRARFGELASLGVAELALAIPDVPEVATRESMVAGLAPTA